jgi:hypothetical protein
MRGEGKKESCRIPFTRIVSLIRNERETEGREKKTLEPRCELTAAWMRQLHGVRVRTMANLNQPPRGVILGSD